MGCTFCLKNIDLFQENVLQDEYILFPYNIYLYQKNWRTGIRLRKVPTSHLLYLFYSKISPTLKTNRRSILIKLTSWEGPTSQELPNKLILQTGHRNAQAKHAPWTPNATNIAIGLAAQTCQFDKPCTNLAWYSFPGEPQCQKDLPNHLLTRIQKTAAKENILSWHKIPGQHTSNFTTIN